jgi:YebC/PmpR family DNA-binding regulatory protein
MSGHNKWSTIKRKKGANDAARAKVFTKIGRELAVAVKNGGPDPNNNAKLRDVIAKAKQNNVPNDNIDRMLKKAAGESDSTNFEEIVYEGYGPSGIAVVVEALTDNRNRTASEVRHYFDKAGGNMGTPGSVTFMFDRQGVIVIEKEDVDEDQLMEDALEAGASDFLTDEEDIFEIRTEPNDVGAIRDELEGKGYHIISSEAAYIPQTYTRLESEEDMKNMARMIDMFETTTFKTFGTTGKMRTNTKADF